MRVRVHESVRGRARSPTMERSRRSRIGSTRDGCERTMFPLGIGPTEFRIALFRATLLGFRSILRTRPRLSRFCGRYKSARVGSDGGMVKRAGQLSETSAKGDTFAPLRHGAAVLYTRGSCVRVIIYRSRLSLCSAPHIWPT